MTPELPEDMSHEELAAYNRGVRDGVRMSANEVLSIIDEDDDQDEQEDLCECGAKKVQTFGGKKCPDCDIDKT